MTTNEHTARLEELRQELRAERISQGELIELASLAPFIDPGDVELLEAAGVPEFPDEPTTDYSTSKFENATAEAAYAIILDGMAEESDGDVDTGGAYDLVVVDGRHVIIRTDSQGFVWVDYQEVHHSIDHAAIVARWAEITRANDIDDEA